MTYLLAGKLMSYLSFRAVYEVLQNYSDLILFDSFIGWFLLENTFEEYDLTAGKRFLISEDFRTLIKNLMLLARNFMLLAQVFTPLEFIGLNLCILIFFFLYKLKNFKNRSFQSFSLFYLLLLQSFVYINVFFTFILITNFLHIWLMTTCMSVYLIIFYAQFFIYNLSYNYKTVLSSLIIKIMSYLIFIVLLLFLTFQFFLQTAIVSSNNFVIESSITLLIPYSFIYFKIVFKFELKSVCQQLISFVKPNGSLKLEEIKSLRYSPTHKKKVFV